MVLADLLHALGEEIQDPEEGTVWYEEEDGRTRRNDTD
jgi:hypothetical protein